MTEVFRLPDGAYDVLVIDATADGDALAIEITILKGEHKGDVDALRAQGLDIDEIELLGLPGVLHVDEGVPRFVVDG